MFFDNIEDRRVENVINAFNIYKDYEKKVGEMQYISNTLKEKYVSVLKHNYGFDDVPLLIGNYLKEKTKSMSRIVKHRLNDIFGKYKWDLGKIVFCGYECYAYQVSFTFNRKSYYIQIPNYSNITPNIIEYVDNGMYSLWQKDSKNCSTLIFKHYSKEKVAEFIKNLDKENKINEQEETTRI